VPTAEAEGVLLARGLVKAVAEPKEKAGKIELDIERLKKSIEREIEKEFREDAYDTIASVIRSTPDTRASSLITPQLLRAWLIRLIDETPAKDLANLLQMTFADDQTETQREESVRLRIRAADSATIYQAAALHMIDGDRDRDRPYQLQEKNPTPLFAAAAADKCIDLPGLRAQVTKEVKARIAGEIAALKAQLKPPKPLVPTASLAQPVVSPDADANPPKAQAKPAPPRKPKLSAQEAQSGIAAAMQGIEAGQVPCPDVPSGKRVQARAEGQQVNSQSPEQCQLLVGVAVGQRVRVLANVSARFSKWIGKEGTVTKPMGESAWDVTFRGRNGGLASFDVSELEVVA